jgi:CubicO group peptidase (beta-lactamase class C family)
MTLDLHVRRATALLAALLLVVAAVGPAVANPAPPLAGPEARPVAETPGAVLDSVRGTVVEDAELEAFFDARMRVHLAQYRVPGAVVVVVRDDEVVLAKGYGVGNVETGEPMTPDTVVAMGSVGKVVTTTAAVQLAEAGRLDLDADVNDYLVGSPVRVPATGDGPITARHLGTHTAGFDYRGAIAAPSPAERRSIETFLVEELPPRVRPPGTVANYDNHGFTLLGYLIERQSGRPYADYVDAEVFGRLGMTDSVTDDALPPRLEVRRATGYTYSTADGAYVPAPRLYVEAAPAGSMYTTAADMGAFVAATLNEGRYGDAQLVSPAGMATLHGRQFANAPGSGLPAMAYGFAEYDAFGVDAVGKSGDVVEFSTDLVVLPDHDIGYFVAYTSNGGAEARVLLRQAFLRRYADSAALAAANTTYDGPGSAVAVAGTYASGRHSLSTHEKLLGLFGTHEFVALDEYTIAVAGGPPELTFVEVRPGVFYSPTYGVAVAFRTGPDGRDYAVTSNGPSDVAVRVPWYLTPGAVLPSVAIELVVLATALVGWPAAALARRVRGGWRGRRGSTATPRPDGGLGTGSGFARRARTVALAGAGASVVAVGGWLAVVSDPLASFVYGPTLPVRVLLPVGLFVAATALATVVAAGVAWRDRRWSLLARVHYSLVALALAALAATLAYWNLAGVSP